MRVLKGMKDEPKKCEPLLRQVIPSFLHAIRREFLLTTDQSLREALLEQLTVVVLVVRGSIKQYMPHLIAEIRQLWQVNLKQILQLVQALAGALGEDFKVSSDI